MSVGYVKYKDYFGAISVDTETGCLYASAIGMRDVISAQAETVKGLNQAFADSVEDYLAFCREDGVEPEKPVSGQIPARIGAVRHYRLKRLSAISRRSINDIVAAAIEAELARCEDELEIEHDVPPAISEMEAQKSA